MKVSVTALPVASSFTQTQHLRNQQLNSTGVAEELGVKHRRKRGVGVRCFKIFSLNFLLSYADLAGNKLN